MGYYELLHKLNHWKQKYKEDIREKNLQIKNLKTKNKNLESKIIKIQNNDFFFEKWQKAAFRNEFLSQENWILTRIIRKIKHYPIKPLFSLESLYYEAHNEYLKKFGISQEKTHFKHLFLEG